MALSEDLVRVTIRGSFLSAAAGPVIEQFVTGFHLWRHSEPAASWDWSENTQQVAVDVRDRWATRFTAMASRWSQTVRFDEVRAYHLTPAGTTLDLGVSPFVALAGTGGSSLPTECALAVSLYSYAAGAFNPDGGKARGRMYLPAPNVGQVGVDGVVALSAADAIANEMDTFFESVQGMNAEDDLPTTSHWDLVIASNVDAGRRQVVRSRVGRVMDVQRRRRRSIPEGYVDRVLANH